VCVPDPALSLSVRVALRAPVEPADGANATPMVQVGVAGTTVAPVHWSVRWKSEALAPLTAVPVTLRVPPAVEVTVRTWEALVVPMAWEPNVRELEERLATGLMVSLPIAAAAFCSVNQMLPSGPAVIPVGGTFGENAPAVRPVPNEVTVPVMSIRLIALAPWSTNHMLPSGPAVMAPGEVMPVVVGVMVPMVPLPNPVNHRLPSGPTMTSVGVLVGNSMGNSCMVPVASDVPTSPTWLALTLFSTNHRFEPSAASATGVLPPVVVVT